MSRPSELRAQSHRVTHFSLPRLVRARACWLQRFTAASDPPRSRGDRSDSHNKHAGLEEQVDLRRNGGFGRPLRSRVSRSLLLDPGSLSANTSDLSPWSRCGWLSPPEPCTDGFTAYWQRKSEPDQDQRLHQGAGPTQHGLWWTRTSTGQLMSAPPASEIPRRNAVTSIHRAPR